MLYCAGTHCAMLRNAILYSADVCSVEKKDSMNLSLVADGLYYRSGKNFRNLYRREPHRRTTKYWSNVYLNLWWQFFSATGFGIGFHCLVGFLEGRRAVEIQ